MRLSYCTSNNAQHTLWLSPNMQACSFIKSLRVLQSVRSGGCTVVCQQAENDPLVAVGLLHLSIKQPELQAHLSVSQTESNDHRWKVCRLYCFSGWFVMEMLPQTEPNGPSRILFIMSSLSRWLNRWALHFEWNESGCSSTAVNMESISAVNSCFHKETWRNRVFSISNTKAFGMTKRDEVSGCKMFTEKLHFPTPLEDVTPWGQNVFINLLLHHAWYHRI